VCVCPAWADKLREEKRRGRLLTDDVTGLQTAKLELEREVSAKRPRSYRSRLLKAEMEST
jgi:hypothetical protein